MIHIKRIGDFINESRGAALKDRTPDRFVDGKMNGEVLIKQWAKVLDELCSMFNDHGEDEARKLGIEPSDEFWIGSPDWGGMPLSIAIDQFGFFGINGDSWRTITNSQRNALDRIGLNWDNLDGANGHTESNRAFFKWLSEKMLKKLNTVDGFNDMGEGDWFFSKFDGDDVRITAGNFLLEGGVLSNPSGRMTLDIYCIPTPLCWEMETVDDMRADKEDTEAIAEEIVDKDMVGSASCSPLEYKKTAISFYRGIIKLIGDILYAEKKRIMGSE